MTVTALVHSLRLFAAAYLLLVAMTAAWGWHRPLLAYPFRIGYSAARLAVATVTLGKVTMVPAGKKIKRRGSRKLRNWRFELQEYRELRAERRGEIVRPASAGWSTTSSHEDSHYEEAPVVPPAYEAPSAPPAFEPAPAPTHQPSQAQRPGRSSLFDDDEDDDDEMPLPPFFE